MHFIKIGDRRERQRERERGKVRGREKNENEKAVRSNNKLQGCTRRFCLGFRDIERGLSAPLEMIAIRFPRDLGEVSPVVCW